MKYLVLAILCALIGCEGAKETRILLISSQQPQAKLVKDEIIRFSESADFSLRCSQNLASIHEDSLKQFANVIINHIAPNKLNHFQVNALERYVEAGGGYLVVGSTNADLNKYKWPIFHPIFSQETSTSTQFNTGILSQSFGKGQVVLINIGPAAPDEQKALISEGLSKATDQDTPLEYDGLSITLAPPDHWFVVDTLAMSFNEPIEMEVTRNGNVILIERAGAIKIYESNHGSIKTIGQLPVVYSQSNGLNGMALDPDFENTGFVFFSYTPLKDRGHHRISRFKITSDSLYLPSEQVLLEIPINIENGWHGINTMEFDSKGNLYFAIGDFTIQTGEVAGYAQIDERRESNDSQRTSANTNNLQGKINRIHPEKDGTYTIPEDNLFPDSDSLTKPEIFVMGCRNPYRFILDAHTDLLYFGDVGPDALENGEKGPRGYDELNIAETPGYYGWPYLVADNKPYRDFDYETGKLGPFFDPDHLTNDSPHNTGRKDLLPARKAIFWYPKGASSEFPYLGSGGMNIMVGPKYYIEDYPESSVRLPFHFSGKLFLYDWVRDWIVTIELNKNSEVVRIEPFLSSRKFTKIIDMKLGPDGTLYLLEYGSSGYKANQDASLTRIVYDMGRSKPKLGEAFSQSELTGPFGSHYLPENLADSAVLQLMISHNCLDCHQLNTKLIGPSFVDIAKRYGGEDSARNYLPKRIISGGTGNWPGNIAMPANPSIKETEAKEIVKFIVGLEDFNDLPESIN